MLILMGAAAPSWKYIMQNTREQELYFRGNQIAQAIEELPGKTGGALPPSLETPRGAEVPAQGATRTR